MKEATIKSVNIIAEMIEDAIKDNDLTECQLNQLMGICQAMKWMAPYYSDDVNVETVKDKFEHYENVLVKKPTWR